MRVCIGMNMRMPLSIWVEPYVLDITIVHQSKEDHHGKLGYSILESISNTGL